MRSKCRECEFYDICSKGDVSKAHYNDYFYGSDKMCHEFCPTTFYCTREKGHDGFHQAGIGQYNIVALWGKDEYNENMNRIF